MRHVVFFCAFLVIAVSFAVAPRSSHARGHDGFYFGLGPMTIPMIAMEHRLTAPGGQSQRIEFMPGPGAFLLVGYDIPNTNWGIQMPMEWHYFRLNRQEWVNSVGSNLEAVWRLAQWPNGFEFHVVGGAGWTHFFEGSIQNRSRATGINFGVGPGVSWFFARGDTRASLTFEVPFRIIHFFGDNLSRGGTTVMAFPVRFGVTIGF